MLRKYEYLSKVIAEWKTQLAPLEKLGMKVVDQVMASFKTDPDSMPIEFLGYKMEITKDEWNERSKIFGSGS